MSFPPTEVLAAAAVTALGGVGLLAALVVADRLLGRISSRLADLHAGLDPIASATEPLTARISAVARNVARLREAAADFNRALAERAAAHRIPADGGTQ